MDELTIYYQNCRGIRTKLNILYMNILSNCYDIIILTETWLTPQILDDEFIDNRYIVYRCDRDRIATNKKEGGGVLVAVLKDLRSTLIPLDPPATSHIEQVLIQLPGSNRDSKCVICAVYIPPKSTDETYLSHYNHLHDILDRLNIHLFYMFGDYNLPNISWLPSNDGDATALQCNGNNSLSEHMSNFMSLLNAAQFNHILNHKGRILDLLISNTNCIVSIPTCILLPIDDYHPPFCTTITHISKNNKNLLQAKILKYNYYKADYEQINRDLCKIDWNQTFNGLSVEQCVSTFYNNILGTIKTYTPISHSKSSRFPVWFSRSLIRIFNGKNKAWIKWKTYNNLSDYEQFSFLRQSFQMECKKCYSRYIDGVEDNIRKNVKNLWSYVANRKSNGGIPASVVYKNVNSSDPNSICDMFSDFFQSVYEATTFNDSDWSPPEIFSDKCVIINHISFSPDQVLQALKSLDVTKGPGPDGLPPYFIRRAADSLYIPLNHIYNKCITEGTFPEVWKQAYITPVHKTGSKHDVENYRPISILSALSKVFERLVHKAIYPTIHNIILTQQHGFVQKRSTATNLLTFTDYLFNNMDGQVQVDAVYTDFRKAFDKVDHELLLRKLAYNGIRGDLLRWFASYVSNRSQRVVVKGYRSNSIGVTSGVPQGSILGPLLFILFINDIESCFIHSKFLLYADDLKIYRPIRDHTDTVLLQEDLNRFSSYCVENKIQLSSSKCVCITFTKKINFVNSSYTLDNCILQRVTSVKDLGILLDSKLHLDKHIHKIINNAFRMYGFVMRAASDFKRIDTYMHLYKSLIRSQLEYAVQIWNPLYKKYIDSLERVQNKFLKALKYRCRHDLSLPNSPHKNIDLLSLESRRLFLETMFLYDLCNGRYDCIDLANKLSYVVPRTVILRGVRARPLFAVSSCRTNAGVRAPLRRMAKNFNDVFVDLDMFTLSSNKFRISLINLVSGSDK